MIKKLEKLLKDEIKKIERPFGIFLSGGIDSGLLAALSKPDFAVTCYFPEGRKYDELKYAKAIARHLKIPLDVIEPKREAFRITLKSALQLIKKPINSISIVPWFCLMLECEGKTMINGEGADELFGGYSRYLILKHVFELYKKEELKNYYDTLDSVFNDLHSKLIGRDFLFATTNLEAIMQLEFQENLPDIIFMEKAIAKYFDVDLHQPFMSEKIKEFAWELPFKYKIQDFTTKWILRKLAEKYLPEEVVGRKDKMGLVCPINKWQNWTGEKGEFDKAQYLNYQKRILRNYGI